MLETILGFIRIVFMNNNICSKSYKKYTINTLVIFRNGSILIIWRIFKLEFIIVEYDFNGHKELPAIVTFFIFFWF